MRNGTGYLSGTLLAAVASLPAGAQEAIPRGFEEIVVTASKRTENLQDVPISLSAISGDLMVRQRVLRLEQLTSFVPNLQFASSSGKARRSFRCAAFP